MDQKWLILRTLEEFKNLLPLISTLAFFRPFSPNYSSCGWNLSMAGAECRRQFLGSSVWCFGAGLLCWCSQAAQMKVFSQNLSAEPGLWAWLCPAGLWSRAGCHPLGTPALALPAAIPLLSHLFVQKLWHLRARSKRTFWGGAGGLCVARKKHLQTAKMDVSLTKAKNT